LEKHHHLAIRLVDAVRWI